MEIEAANQGGPRLRKAAALHCKGPTRFALRHLRLLGDTNDLTGDEEIGVVHGIDEKNVLHTDTVALGNPAQGIALADGVNDRIGLD